MDIIRMDIIRYLAVRRKALQRSLDEIKAKTGLGKPHLSRILAGGLDIRVSTLEALASALDTEIIAVPKDMAFEVRQFIASRGQAAAPQSKSAAETFLERS